MVKKLSLKKRMSKNFSKEEQRVLKILNYTYYNSQNQWSLDKGEMFVIETQLGYSTYKARKKVIKALDIFEEYSEKQVLKWLEY